MLTAIGASSMVSSRKQAIMFYSTCYIESWNWKEWDRTSSSLSSLTCHPSTSRRRAPMTGLTHPESRLFSFILVSVVSLLPDGHVIRLGTIVVSVLALSASLIRAHLPQNKFQSLSSELDDVEKMLEECLLRRLFTSTDPLTMQLQLTLVRWVYLQCAIFHFSEHFSQDKA